ncbi:MAG: glucosamine-6-phosphate deaminase [Pirellulales bacterium]|jgi:glucosamine-6-phosphate deaminase|nr:glucosamine-6-phosphate deaminase [Pirellulales bacterium]
MSTESESTTIDQLRVVRHADRQSLGQAAGQEIAAFLRERLGEQANVRVVFAAAPSQNETLATLVAAEGIDWSRVVAFHMDEYVGLAIDATQRFSRYLREQLFDRVQPGRVELIGVEHSLATLADAEVECQRYAGLLTEAPIDLVCLGIGENGHIAFNDPPVADFDDSLAVKPVELDLACRQQQVNDGCFPTLNAVPTHAVTLTIPTLVRAERMVCAVPGPTKREAVAGVLAGPVSTACPATILRTHAGCTLHVDADSCPQLS